jgi:hypothetical protein
MEVSMSSGHQSDNLATMRDDPLSEFSKGNINLLVAT